MSENLLNVVDVEATCWNGERPPGAVNEIIEIGIAVVDLASAQRVRRHGIVVRPERSEVSAFCTDLTGITQDEVDTGMSFAQACVVLADEFDSGARMWASWGDYDRNQFTRQCAEAAVPYPFGSRHVNAKALFAVEYSLSRSGMASALRKAGLPLEGRHHRGEDDAWNIAALVLHLRERGAWPDAAAAELPTTTP